MSQFIKSAFSSMAKSYFEDKAEGYAAEHFQPTKDPYYEKLDNGKQRRRRLPEYCTKQESTTWKSIQNKAWLHDKSIFGCCCWTELIGCGPLVSIIPVFGPILMYVVHNSLIELADREYDLSTELQIKLHANIIFDFCISLVPILGAIFTWMNGPSTRNASMIYNFVGQRALERMQQEEKKAGHPLVVAGKEHLDQAQGTAAGTAAALGTTPAKANINQQPIKKPQPALVKQTPSVPPSRKTPPIPSSAGKIPTIPARTYIHSDPNK